MTTRLGFLAVLALLASTMATPRAEAQVVGGAAGYNPYTGTSAARSAAYNPYTGGAARSGAAYNPYTGTRAAGSSSYNPYTGNVRTTQAAYNPYTGRYGARTSVRHY